MIVYPRRRLRFAQRPSIVLLFALPVIAALAVVACSSGDNNDTGVSTASASDGSLASSGGEGGMDGPQIDAPPGCDLTKEPKDAPACVDDGVGVFVDAKSGNDTGAGTKAAPFKTIGKAVASAGQKRVYVCEGDYPENVKLTSAVSIYGGFACGAWSFSGNKPNVVPASGFALEVANVAGPATIADASFTAPPGTEDAPNSIAAFVSSSPKLLLLRNALTAKAGSRGKDRTKGADGALLSSMPTPNTLDGNSATGNGGSAAQICTCVGGASSKGGGGGAFGSDGTNGETAPAGADPTAGKGSTSAECAGGTNGHNGANALPVAAADGAKNRGSLSAEGWVPESGKDGNAGGAGQGGGGGGGAAAGTGGGGSGSCGGCGGGGGRGGGGGGASVALLALDSAIEVRSSTLVAANAGAGGTGGAGGDGIDGGIRGGGTGNGCPGGIGGKGAAGGAGGGGAGGISAAILAKGAMPIASGSMLKAGSAGGAGKGGATPTNDGVAGEAGETVTLQ